MNTTIEADYLIIGAGAGGLSFADTLLAESDATIAIIDERDRPGGHWVDAYEFVRLHAPASFYGVSSLPLGQGRIETEGLNAGFLELSNREELCAYFARVMRDVLLPSGRVQYFPRSRYENGRVISLDTGETRDIRVRRKTVDTAYVAGAIPSRHKPNYAIAPGVWHEPVNALAELSPRAERYAIIGAGKTGLDAVSHLLSSGVAPDAITWIMPQDPWLLNRLINQQDEQFLQPAMEMMAAQMEVAASAQSVGELFAGLERERVLMRLDPNVTPSAYRCATVTEAEVAHLRRVKNVVRMGRVKAIGADRIVLERGEIATDARTLHVDCSAKGIAQKPPRNVFDGDVIRVQFVRLCQPTFSAAFIAYVEAHYSDETQKNKLCGVIPSPDRAIEWLSMHALNAANSVRWHQEPALTQWLARTRLNAVGYLLRAPEAMTLAQGAARARLRTAMPNAIANLRRLLATDAGAGR